MANRIGLVGMAPLNNLASTHFCLANPGEEYLVYLFKGGEVTVNLSAVSGRLAVEWIHPLEGTITPGAPIAGGAERSFEAPFAGEAVLYLKTARAR